MTSPAQAAGIHAAVQLLRVGRFGGVRFTKVVIGGHSLGSILAIGAASTYPGTPTGCSSPVSSTTSIQTAADGSDAGGSSASGNPPPSRRLSFPPRAARELELSILDTGLRLLRNGVTA